MGVADAAKGGDRIKTLIAMRDKLANELDNSTSGRDIAALSKQLADVLREIDEMPSLEELSAVDEISARRAERFLNRQ